MALPTKGTIPDQDSNDRHLSDQNSNNVARGLSQLENNANTPSDDQSSQGIQGADNFANLESKDGNPYDNYYKKKLGGNKNGQHVDTHGDTVQDNFNSDAPNLKNKEENPSSLYKSSDEASVAPRAGSRWWTKLRNVSGRGAATGGAVGLVVGGFGFTSIILAPASLLVTIEKNITSRDSDSTRTNISFRRAYIGRLFSNSTGGTEIEKKMTKMSPEQKARWEKANFKVELTNDGKIKTMQFPDGKTVDSGAKFNSHAENTPEGRRAVSNVLDSRSAFFQNEKFKNVLKNFKIVKSKRLSASDDRDPQKRKEAIDKSFDENTDLKSQDEKARLERLKATTVGEDGSKIKGKVDEISKKAGKAAGAAFPLSLACATYNVSRLTTATIKAQWIYELIRFAYPFMRAASQIEDQGNIEPSVVENLANRLTWYNPDTKAPDYNHSALDSQGLKMAIYGDYTSLTELTKKYTSWQWQKSINSTAQKYVNWANSVLGGKKNVKLLCRATHEAQVVGLIACFNDPIAAIICGAGMAAAPAVEKWLIPKVVVALSKPALDYLSTIDVSSSVQGEPAGNLIAAGMGFLLQNASLGNTLRPASNVEQVKNFIAKTNDTNYKYTTQLTMDEARQNPFDATNQYSFMGRIAAMVNPYISNDGTLFGRIANLTSAVNISFARLPMTAHALFSQPSNLTLQDTLSGDATANNLGKCEDPDLKDIGAVCDWSGRTVGYTDDRILNGLDAMANNSSTPGSDLLSKSITFMMNDTTTINDVATGLPTKTIHGDIDPNTGETVADSNFDNYIKYCIERKNDDGNGTIPIGSSTQPIADDSGNWFDGERCMGKDAKDQQMLDSFATYYNWCYVQYATAERMTDCVHNQPEANNVASVSSNCGDGSTASIYKCAVQFDPYAYSYGAGHDEYGKVSWYQNFKSNTPAPDANPFDCSSLVMGAVVAAFGQDIPGMSAPGSFHDTKYWQRLPDGSAQQGDVIVWDGHVEIIKSSDGSGYTTFGAHTHHANNPEADISEAHYGIHGDGMGDVYDGVYRYVGPGVKSGNISV